MNEQKAPNGIEWTRVILADGTRTRGFTWNVFGGCKHACEWEMPDGTVAGCYAKLVAERVAQEHYPQGFAAHYFHPKRLVEPSRQKQPVGIFLDSMADAMGHWVNEDEIKQVLDVCRSTPQHIYFLLTKNAPRLLDFDFPDNVWTGVSSPPDWMFGKRLSRKQQEAMLHRTMKVLSQVKSKVRWISFEPLSWDCSDIIAEYPGVLQWAVVGGASNGPREFPPSLTDLVRLLTVLDDQTVPVFYKGNLHTLPWASTHWREDFPTSPTRAPKLVDSAGKTQAECLEEARGHQVRAFEIAELDDELSGVYAAYAAYWYEAAARLRPARPLPPLREFAMMTPDGLVRGTADELAAMKAPSVESIKPLIADLPAAVEVTPMATDYADPFDLPANAKVISLWQPWASLMLIGAKQVETRSWSTPHRGTLVIHASKKWDEENAPFAQLEPFRSALVAAGLVPNALPLGAALGTVILDTVQKTQDIWYNLSEQEIKFGDYTPGRFGWLTSRPRPFREPLPVAGEQGLRDWSSYLAKIGKPIGFDAITEPDAPDEPPTSLFVDKVVIVPGQDPNLVRGRIKKLQDGEAMIAFNQQATWVPYREVQPHPEATTTVYTARVGSRDEDAIDITVKSASTEIGAFFAPTWDMVNGVKSGKISEAQYTAMYEALLRSRYSANEKMLSAFLWDRRRVVFTCYCAVGEFCHRHLAVNVLEKIGMKFGYTVVHGGELEPPKPEAPPVQMSMFGDEPPKKSKVYA